MKKTYIMSKRNIGEGIIFRWSDKMNGCSAIKRADIDKDVANRCEIGRRLWDIFEEKCKKDEDIGDAYLSYMTHVHCCNICEEWGSQRK